MAIDGEIYQDAHLAPLGPDSEIYSSPKSAAADLHKGVSNLEFRVNPRIARHPEVDAAPMVQSTHHDNAFARTRVRRVLDQNVKGLFLGSMSPSRRAVSASSNSACCAPACSMPLGPKRGVAS